MLSLFSLDGTFNLQINKYKINPKINTKLYFSMVKKNIKGKIDQKVFYHNLKTPNFF